MNKSVALLIFVILLFPTVAARAGFSFVDGGGREVRVEKTFSRIISLYSAHTENLMSLGAGSELIGISSSDDYPPEALGKPRFSYRDDPEKFIAARPDLVLVRPMIERAYPQLIEKLRQAGIAVVSLQPTGIEGIFDYWLTLGRLCGRESAAHVMIGRFRKGLAGIVAKVAQIPVDKRRRVYFESIHRKMKTFAPQSIAMYALKQAGGLNVADDAFRVRQTNIAAYGKERILAKSEEIDVFLAQQGRMNPIDRDTIVNEPGFQAIRAIRRGNIHLVDERIVSRPTVRILDGIRTIAGMLYPALFGGPVAGEGDNGG